MKLIVLLAAVLIVGLLFLQQLDKEPSPPENVVGNNPAAPEAPRVPTNPEELKTFENDINQFMDDAAKKRMEQVE